MERRLHLTATCYTPDHAVIEHLSEGVLSSAIHPIRLLLYLASELTITLQ